MDIFGVFDHHSNCTKESHLNGWNENIIDTENMFVCEP